MSRFSMVLLILALLAAGGTTSGIDLAFAKSVGTPGLTSEQAKILKERVNRVQQRRKARITHMQRKAAAERVSKASAIPLDRQAAPVPGGKEVGQ